MKLKAAILGAGNMGKNHGASLLRLGVELAAICDTSEEARKSFKEKLALPTLAEYADFDAMLAGVAFDLLFICLPPFAQAGQFQKAARAGKHIFIEKPIALNTREGLDMLRSARESGVITQVGFHMRWGTAVRKLASLIKEGRAGRPVLFNGQYECNSLHTPWWIKVELCGGQIFEQAIHLYDLCRLLVADPVQVSGYMSNVCHSHLKEYTVEDVSASIANFAGGAVAAITATNCAVPGKWEGKFTVVFEKLTAFFENPNKARFAYTSGKELVYEDHEEQADLKFTEVRDFIDCVTEGRESACSIREGYLSLCYVEAVVSSARAGGTKIPVANIPADPS